MSRWHDRSAKGLATSVFSAERIADRLADVMLAAEDVVDLLRDAPPSRLAECIRLVMAQIYLESSKLMTQLPLPRETPERDDELTAILEAISRALAEIGHVTGPQYDVALGRVEEQAAPYAIAFYHEIGRLDELLGSRRNRSEARA